MKTKSKLFTIICSMAISYYFLQIINSITLSTNLQRIFVYIYFVFIVNVIIFSLKKVFYKIIKKKKNKIINITSLGLALLLLLIFNYSVIPTQTLNNHLTISVMDNHNKDSKGYEVRLSGIILNDTSIPLSSLEINSDNWSYNDEVIWSETKKASFDLYLPKAKSIQLKFVKHPWSGYVNVDNNNSYNRIIDLYDFSGDELLLNVPVIVNDYNKFTKVILVLGFYIFAVYVIKLLILTVMYINKKRLIKTYS